MQNESPAPEDDRSRELFSFLKGKDNPFQIFVSAREPDAEFIDHHVHKLYPEVMIPLEAALERFRSADLEWENDLPRSGVVVILGERGAGKTHMVHALRWLQHGGPRVVVTPAIFEAYRPFIEYLLHQLVRHFQNESLTAPPGTLERLAEAFTRKVLVQALYGMTEIDWLFLNDDVGRRFQPVDPGKRTTKTPPQFLQLWGWRTKRIVDTKRLLIGDIEHRKQSSLREICDEHEFDFDTLQRIALDQIERTQPNLGIGSQIRKGLYTRLVCFAFDGDEEALYGFLLDGFTQVEVKTQPSRETLVNELFQALLELCLLARMPVVFAFDALETLLGDPPDAGLCNAYFKGIVDVLDCHRGIPFLLFAESGHWNSVLKARGEYAAQRFDQGVVRIAGHGSISKLQFPPITAERLYDVVEARMKPLLEEFFETDDIKHPIAPFRTEDLAAIASSSSGPRSLRMNLQRLRDRYDELVNGKPIAPAEIKVHTPPESPRNERGIEEHLEVSWQQELRAAKRQLDGNLAAHADDLHAGILRWLRIVGSKNNSSANGKPASADQLLIGNHPTYGQIVRYRQEHGGKERAVGIGLLLGTGRGMPTDLEVKLQPLGGTAPPVDVLVLLWPRDADLPPPVQQHFPPGTRAIWNHFEGASVTARVVLRAIDPAFLAPWFFLQRWTNSLPQDIEGVSNEQIERFVTARTADMLAAITP